MSHPLRFAFLLQDKFAVACSVEIVRWVVLMFSVLATYLRHSVLGCPIIREEQSSKHISTRGDGSAISIWLSFVMDQLMLTCCSSLSPGRRLKHRSLGLVFLLMRVQRVNVFAGIMVSIQATGFWRSATRARHGGIK